MLKRWLVLDVASAPIADAASFLEGTVKAPSNYKSEDAIKNYIAEKEAERLAMAATDLDLARLTCLGWSATREPDAITEIMATDEAEKRQVYRFGELLEGALYEGASIVTYGGFRFDLPLLMRRARYLGVEFPRIDLDRYRSVHVDLCELLSDRDPSRRRSLDFYVKRLGWSDLMPKPLEAAEEAQVFSSGRWDDLRASVARDVEATRRLAHWAGIL